MSTRSLTYACICMRCGRAFGSHNPQDFICDACIEKGVPSCVSQRESWWRRILRWMGLSAIAMCFAGCTASIEALKAPPFPYAVIHHTRAFGFETTIPNQAGDAVLKIRLGFFSDSISIIPCATNEIHMPTISDTFTIGQGFSLSPSTHIAEDLQTGWTGPPPTPRLQVFPKSLTVTNQPVVRSPRLSSDTMP